MPEGDSSARQSRVASRLFGVAAQSAYVGRFEIREALGAGASGTVFAAWDPELQRHVAIKLLSTRVASAVGSREKLAEEARALAKVSSRHVVAVYEIGEHDGGLFIVMELVPGTNLRRWQLRDVHPQRDVIEKYVQAAEGLAAIHSAGLVHRDFKPANVLVRTTGDVLVADFGMARLLPTPAPTEATRRGSPGSDTGSASGHGGTPPYMAPEQLALGCVDHLSDQFSFCVAFWEGLTGDRPYDADALRRLTTAVDSVPALASPPQMPRWLSQVLARGLAAAPSDRWPSMDALVRVLRETPLRRQRTRRNLILLPVALIASAPYFFGAGRPDCDDGLATIEASWNSAVVEDLRRTAEAGPAFAAPAMDDAIARVQRHVDEWTRTRVEACRATWERRQSDEQLDLAVACLDRGLQNLETAVAILATGAPESLARAPSLVDELQPPSSCLDTAILRGPQSLAESAAENSSIDRAVLLTAAGRFDEAVATASETRNASQVSGDLYTYSRAALAEGIALAAAGRASDAKVSLLAAVQPAIANDYPQLVAEAFLHLTRLAARETLDLDDARTWEALAQASSERGPLSVVSRADLLDARGFVAMLAADPATAERLHGEALDLLMRELPDDTVRQSRSRRFLGAAVSAGGDHERARQTFEQVLADISSVLGRDHPDIAAVEFDLGLEASATQRAEDALRHFKTALALQRAAFGSHSIRLAPALTVLAQTHLALGDSVSAEAEAAEAWALQRTLLPYGHPDRGGALAMLASIRANAGDFELAIADHELLLHERAKTRTERERILTEHNLAWLLTQVGRVRESRPIHTRLLNETAANDPIHQYSASGLAAVELAEGDPVAARTRVDAVLAQVHTEAIDDDALLGELYWIGARALAASGADRQAIVDELRRSRGAYARAGERADLIQRIDAMLAERGAAQEAEH